MFRVEDGLIHFVFCNEDEYLLDSFIRLNLTDYLHYLLTKQGYQGIYFIAGRGNGIDIQFLDRESGTHFPKTMMERFRYTLQECGSLTMNAAEAAERLASLLTERRRHNAIVIQNVDDFQKMVRGSRTLRNVLCESRAVSRDSIVVLLFRPKASFCLPALTGEESVFAIRDYAMCRELKHAVDMEVSDLFGEMRDRLKGRCVFLNELSPDRVRACLENYLMFEAPEFTETKREIEDAAWLIYTWYHSEEMQLEYAGLLPENPEGSASRLQDSLPGVWKKLLRQLEEIRRKNPGVPVRRILAEQYPDDGRCPVEADTRLAQEVQRLIRGALREHTDARFSVDRRRLKEIERKYTSFGGRQPGKMMKWLLQRCINWARESMDEGDADSFRSCLTLLELAHREKLQWPEEEDEESGWKSWNTLLEYSRMRFRTHNQLDQMVKSVSEQQRELKACEEEAERRREEGFPEKSVVLQSVYGRIEVCREQIENLRTVHKQTLAFSKSLNQDLTIVKAYAENFFCDAMDFDSLTRLRKMRRMADQATNRMQKHCREYMDRQTDGRYRSDPLGYYEGFDY